MDIKKIDIKRINPREISAKRAPIRSKLLPPELLVITESRTESRTISGNTISGNKNAIADLFDDDDEDDSGDESFAIPWDDIARSWKRYGEKYRGSNPKRTPIKH